MEIEVSVTINVREEEQQMYTALGMSELVCQRLLERLESNHEVAWRIVSDESTKSIAA